MLSVTVEASPGVLKPLCTRFGRRLLPADSQLATLESLLTPVCQCHTFLCLPSHSASAGARPYLRLCAAGVPFRETHHISGAAVKMAEDKGCQLSDLTVADLATINPLFTDDVTQACLTLMCHL